MFEDRLEAGKLLAVRLAEYKKKPNVLLLGIPRGGVVVAKPVSQDLDLPLGVVVVKKIPAPGQEELAIGAVGPNGSFVLDRGLIESLDLSQESVDGAVRKAEAKRDEYAGKFKTGDIDVRAKTVIVIDDGAATGSTVEVAVKYLKSQKAGKIIVALPVAPPEIARRIKTDADEAVILETPPSFDSVGQFYRNFPQLGDEEVIKLLS